MSKGILFVISGPSAVGKTTLARGLVSQDEGLYLTKSHTTRPDPDLSDDEYLHVTNHEFEQGIDSNFFFEHTTYCGYLYGVSHGELAFSQKKGRDSVLVMDVEGAVRLMGRNLDYPLVTIFLIPDNLDTLQHRILQRKRDNFSDIGRRMDTAARELHAVGLFDHQVLVEFDAPVEELVEVVAGIVSVSRKQRGVSLIQGSV